MKVSKKLGGFLHIKRCTNCAWFEEPIPMFPRFVCPDCGDELRVDVGQFVLEEQKKLFGTTSKVVGVLWRGA